ncbi:hypothetical protein C7212DRAFT_280583 [Tuber magnatum]|uniref:WW domain-containing protein n=1 Tax=Tuber magnatum TaxID=42249 RepID=A0A317ST24_9PEZI|nr:hypothetical protein C7212DRAFT_280583 [Tuber magnatum]
MNMSASPPPSYASLSHAGSGPSNGTTAQGHPNEKHTVVVGAAAPQELPHNNHTVHPAFHNDPPQEQLQQPPQPPIQSQPQQPPQQQEQQQQQQPQPHPQEHSQSPHPSFTQEQRHFTPSPAVGPSSPPPLPEGWMAHLDPNSGQYYYIHIPTSRTQWEPPLPEPAFNPPPAASPALPTTTYSNVAPLASPGFAPPMTYADPGMSGITSPPPLVHNNSFPIQPPIPQLPLAGIALYNVAPANGEYFGPYLRYTNMDIERGIWLGSIMIVTANPQPPTVHLHQSIDLSPNPRQLKANPIHTHKTYTFYRYDIDIQMGDIGAKWTYAITSHLGCTRYEFLVAGRTERNWRFIAHSCNDFSLGVKAEERAKLGGVGFMWKDVMQKHIETGGFHAQMAGGDQIYADRLWREIPLLKEWLEIKGKENRKVAPWTAAHEEEVTHAYFHYYSAHFDQPHLREAWAQIPHLCQIDDHDIFDGFGSYPEYMQFSSMFKNIGRVAVHWYLLFQHHTTLDILHASPDDRDLFTVTGTGWHFVKYLGPAITVVGIDCRSERNPQQVMAGPTYQGIFPRIATLPPSVQHCILMVSVPVIYPRLDTAESVVNTVATGKKAMTGTYNLLGKVVGSAAGIVGGKEVVGSGFQSVKKAFGKSGLMSSVVSIFGEVDILDDLRDHWTHESKDLERTYLIRTLQGISHSRSLRMTFLSGDVHCCGAGLVHDPTKPQDHKTMYQIITSAIVNSPLPNMVLKILHNNKPLYVPQNGMRSTGAPSDTKEDMLEIFQTDVNGQFRELKKLMGRRNYAIFCAFDPQSAAGSSIGATNAQGGSLSLAVDFIVQGEGLYSNTAKYGPVVVPRVEFGY